MNEINVYGPWVAFLASCTWALGSANYSKLSRDYRPFDVNFTRALLSFPAFLLFVIVLSGGVEGAWDAIRTLPARQVNWLTLSVISSYALGDVFFLWSTVSLGVPGALAIASGYPILTALIGTVFEGQAMHALQWTGLFIAVGGIAIVILNAPKRPVVGGPGEGAEIRSHRWLKKKPVGVALAMLTAVAWASNTYAVAKGAVGVHPAMANLIRMGLSLALISTISLVSTRKWARPLPVPVLRKYGWIFFVETFGGSIFFVYGLSHSNFALGATLAALAPVLTVPIAVALKLERFSWIRAFAVTIVVVGLSLLFR